MIDVACRPQADRQTVHIVDRSKNIVNNNMLRHKFIRTDRIISFSASSDSQASNICQHRKNGHAFNTHAAFASKPTKSLRSTMPLKEPLPRGPRPSQTPRKHRHRQSLWLFADTTSRLGHDLPVIGLAIGRKAAVRKYVRRDSACYIYIVRP